MEMLQRPILNSILEVISTADESIDVQNLRYKIMDVFFHAILTDGIVFLPSKRDKLKGDILFKNYNEKFLELYKAYYDQFDPINLSQMEDGALRVDIFENLICHNSFRSIEICTDDYLNPQQIHYLLIVNLSMGEKREGTVILTRSKQSNQFDSNDIRTAKLISPYLSHSLFHHRLKRKIEELSGSIHNMRQHLISSFRLSPREVDVVPYLYSGLKNAEIAKKLFVSEVTVKKHLQSIYAKMGVRNRTSLITKILTLNSTKTLSV